MISLSSPLVLTLNAGSSSVKAAVFDGAGTLLMSLRAENIGQARTTLTVDGTTTNVELATHEEAMQKIVERLFETYQKDQFAAVGHRVVHGGTRFAGPAIIDDKAIEELKPLSVFDPLHMPLEILAIERARQYFPEQAHVACFDTAFYSRLPKRAQLLPIPRQYYEKGIRRYGFHGLSYEYVLGQLEGDEADGRIIMAHLGSGASLTAVHRGQPVETTMGATPLSGVMMSTRSGDLDPGLPAVLQATEGMNVDGFNDMAAKRSGLLGVSGISADMASLVDWYSSNEAARDAVDLFCYDIQKAIGSLVAALGGVDTLVFTGGIGEKAPRIRSMICESLACFNIEIDEVANERGEGRISLDDSIAVRVIKTNEEAVIARQVSQIISRGGNE